MRVFALRLVLAAAISAATAPAAAAQWSYKVDLGGAAADGPASASPFLLDASLGWAGERLEVLLAGGRTPTSLMPGGSHGRLTANFRAASWGEPGADGWTA